VQDLFKNLQYHSATQDKMSDETQIKQAYLNRKFSGAFSGLTGFLKNRKKWKDAKKVLQVLRKLKAYSLHKDVRRKFKRRRILVNFRNQTWGSDLKDISSIAKENNNNTFILVVIDILSKKGYMVPIKDKTSKSMIRAFKIIFKQAGAKPMYIFSDR